MATTIPTCTTRASLDDFDNINVPSLPFSMSREIALTLYQDNEKCVPIAVNRFIKQYPAIVSAAYDRDDLLADARLVLWRCCMLYNPNRGARVSTLAFDAIFRRLLDRWRKGIMRTEEGKLVRIELPLSLADPIKEGSNETVGDRLAAVSGGGRWGDNGPSVILHEELLQNAKARWESREPSRRAKSPSMASEIYAVFEQRNTQK